MFTSAEQIERAVEDRPEQGTRAVLLTATLPRRPAEVWEALTDPARVPRWFLPVSGDLRPGGRYQLEGNAGGEITACDPPRHLALTWEMGGDVSWVALDLVPDEDGTRLRLTHEARPSEHWSRYGPGAVGIGWDMALLGLATHLATGEALDPATAMGWFGTAEGLAWIRASSDAWLAADIAGGAPAAEATLAAARTHAFYTGTPEPDAI